MADKLGVIEVHDPIESLKRSQKACFLSRCMHALWRFFAAVIGHFPDLQVQLNSAPVSSAAILAGLSTAPSSPI
jgi:hypothetical protein